MIYIEELQRMVDEICPGAEISVHPDDEETLVVSRTVGLRKKSIEVPTALMKKRNDNAQGLEGASGDPVAVLELLNWLRRAS